MSTLSARFTQSPEEVKRYVLDYTLFLSAGETITGITATISNLTTPPVGAPVLVVSSIALGPSPTLQVVYYVSGGADSQSYEVTFLATTSIGQTLQDVVQYDIVEKT